MPVLAIHSTEIFEHCFSPEMREKALARARQRKAERTRERKIYVHTYTYTRVCSNTHIDKCTSSINFHSHYQAITFPSSIIKDKFSASTAKSFFLTQIFQPRIALLRASVLPVHIVSACACVCVCVSEREREEREERERELVGERERARARRERARGSLMCVNYICIM